MPDNSDSIDVSEILSDLDEAEEELMELLESPEENADEIRTEIRSLFTLTQKTLRSHSDMVSKVKNLTKKLEKTKEKEEKRSERMNDIMKRLVGTEEERDSMQDIQDYVDDRNES